MSKVLTPTEALLPSQKQQHGKATETANANNKQTINNNNHNHNNKNSKATPTGKHKNVCSSTSNSSRSSSISSCSGVTLAGLDLDDLTTSSSIMEFLRKERECDAEVDTESIFQEVSRLADNSDTRSVDEILREAELLMQQQQTLTVSGKGKQAGVLQTTKTKKRGSLSPHAKQKQSIKMNAKYTKSIDNKRPVINAVASPLSSEALLCNGHATTASKATSTLQKADNGTTASTTTPQTPHTFNAFIDNLPTESVLSEESTPKDLDNCTLTSNHNKNNNNHDMTQSMHCAYDTDEGTDTVSEHLWLLFSLYLGGVLVLYYTIYTIYADILTGWIY